MNSTLTNSYQTYSNTAPNGFTAATYIYSNQFSFVSQTSTSDGAVLSAVRSVPIKIGQLTTGRVRYPSVLNHCCMMTAKHDGLNLTLKDNA